MILITFKPREAFARHFIATKTIFKLLTFGGLSVWYLIDLFLIMGATKRKNMKKLEEIVRK